MTSQRHVSLSATRRRQFPGASGPACESQSMGVLLASLRDMLELLAAKIELEGEDGRSETATAWNK